MRSNLTLLSRVPALPYLRRHGVQFPCCRAPTRSSPALTRANPPLNYSPALTRSQLPVNYSSVRTRPNPLPSRSHDAQFPFHAPTRAHLRASTAPTSLPVAPQRAPILARLAPLSRAHASQLGSTLSRSRAPTSSPQLSRAHAPPNYRDPALTRPNFPVPVLTPQLAFHPGPRAHALQVALDPSHAAPICPDSHALTRSNLPLPLSHSRNPIALCDTLYSIALARSNLPPYSLALARSNFSRRSRSRTQSYPSL